MFVVNVSRCCLSVGVWILCSVGSWMMWFMMFVSDVVIVKC